MQEKNDQIIRTDYAEIMQKSYIDYAMSVIIARAHSRCPGWFKTGTEKNVVRYV